MSNAMKENSLELVEKELKTQQQTIQPHHNEACSCTGKCRVCRCQLEKNHSCST